MSHTRTIASRLLSAGVLFTGITPTRAHYTCRGQEPRTWLAYETNKFRRRQIYTDVPWQSPSSRDGAYSTGMEILLDTSAAEIARADCIVAYNTIRDRSDLCVTTLDGFARGRQILLGGTALAWHWRDGRRVEPVGQTVLRRDPEMRVQGITVDQRPGEVGVRFWDQSAGVEWLRQEDVELRKDLVGPSLSVETGGWRLT